MAIVNDWVRDAAIEIGGEGAVRTISAIIVKHCPMKPDTAYVPISDELREAFKFGAMACWELAIHADGRAYSTSDPAAVCAAANWRRVAQILRDHAV